MRCSEEPPALPRKKMEQRTCSHHEGNDRTHPECGTHLALSKPQEVRLERAIQLSFSWWEGGGEQACAVNLYLQLVRAASARSGANEVP